MKTFEKYFELGIRWYVFIILLQYGIGKIIGQQFYRNGKLPDDIASKTLGEVGSFDLAWTFMGYSNTYILFIGSFQILGALLLLFNRTKLIGILILLPILINIIVFDAIFFDDGNYGALASAILYFSLLLLVIFINRITVLKVLKTLTNASIIDKDVTIFKKFLLTFIVVVMLFGIDQFFVNIFGH